MSIRKTRRKKPGQLPPFVAVTWSMLNSRAFKELTGTAAKLLLYFLGKPKVNPTYPEYWDVQFEFTYGERHGVEILDENGDILVTVGNRKDLEKTPKSLNSLVAGAGFEPATFGL